eukprot:gene12221-2851_t
MAEFSGVDKEAQRREIHEATSTHLSDWDPMTDAFQGKAFNNYFEPKYDSNFREKYTVAEGSRALHQSVSPSKAESNKVNLYIGNIPLTLSRDGLKSLLSRAAQVNSLSILPSKDPERGTTYGFASVSSAKDAESVIEAFHNYSFGTRHRLRVKLAMSDEERERQRERQREDEEFYRNLCKEYSENLEANTDNSISSIAAEDYPEKQGQPNSKEVKCSTNGESVLPIAMGSSTGNKKTRLCLACNKEGKLACMRCKGCYCSMDCQTKHWPKHRTDCLGTNRSPKKPHGHLNGTSTSNQGKPEEHLCEEQLLVQLDDLELEEHAIFNIDEIPPQKELPKETQVVIYVVENLTMKGQAVSRENTEEFLELTERLSEHVKGSPQILTEHDCREGILVLFNYQNETCRGVITKVKKATLEVEVLAVDYGNKTTLNISDVYLMPRFGVDLPRQCRTLVLHAFPKDFDKATGEKLSSHLKELVFEKVMLCQVKDVKKGVCHVVLKDRNTGSYINSQMSELLESLTDQSSEKIMLENISMQPIPTECKFDILVTDVVSPSCFYAQIITEDRSNIKALAEMSNLLSKFAEGNTAFSFKPEINELCIAYFADDAAWSRAVVTKKNEDGTYQIMYIDYGNHLEIDPCFLRPITKDLSRLPMQARKFSLHGIQPASSLSGPWTNQEKTFCKETLLMNALCSVDVITKDETCAVKVYLPEIDYYLDQLMIDNGFAVATNRASSKLLATNGEKQPSNSLENQVTRTPVEPIFTIDIEKLKAKETQRVIPVHVESPEEIYVQIADAEKIGKVNEFSALLADMQPVPYMTPRVDDSCCALFTDETWYRAKVLSVNGDICRVFFYDYGNTFEATKDRLRMMPNELKSLPGQAIRVTLCDIEPAGANWTENAKAFLEERIVFQPCMFDVLRTENERTFGKMICEEIGEDVGKLLVDAKLAAVSGTKQGSPSVTKAKESSIQANTSSRSENQAARLQVREPFTINIEKLKAKETQRVIPVHVESPEEIYVQIADAEKIGKVNEFSALFANMQPVPYMTPRVDDSCCALFTDETCYRAKVLSVNGDICRVFFYDYGNTFETTKDRLRMMPNELKSLPGQAIRVTLRDIEPAGANWPENAKAFLEKRIVFQPCMFDVLKTENERTFGKMICEEIGEDVGKLLVDAKLAAVSGTKQGSPSVTKAKESFIQANTSSRSENQAARLQVKAPFTIDIEKLKAKETQRVIPVHVESPEEIYVQVADAEKIGKVNEFSALLADIQPVPYMTPRVDDSCCALFTDETWYRAKVLSVNGDICRVFFYDYGNTFETAKDRLRVMPNEQKSLPGQAIRVTLCDIEPAGANWTENAKAFLEERIVFQPCMFDVLRTENERTFGKMICEEIGEDVGKLLVDAKLAAVSGTKQGSPSVTKAKESSIQANTSSRSENQAARLQVKEPFTIDIEKLKAKETQRVIPVHVESPEEIYVQIADAEKIGKVNEFSALLADIQPVPYMTPRVDDSCCALFTDETWYRAKVLSVNGDICRVSFYDYGNTFETTKDRLRVMPNELKSLPGQAIRVTLCDIEPAGANWTENAKAFLEERIVFQPCMFDVLRTENERTFGKMIFEEIGEDVGKLLVDAKLAAVSGTKQGSPSVTKAKESSIQANTSSRSENQAARLQVREPFTIDIEKLKAKETQRVIPVHVESPEEIYVQIADAEKIGKVNEFSALLADMQPIPYMTPRVDDSCCALFTDETWYRAKVLSVNGDICRVFFYDYGNTFETTKDRLRMMPNQLKSLPGQAIRVTLCDIEPAGAPLAKNAKAFLEERIVFQPCMFDVLRTENERTFGKMICEEIGEDVGKLLVDAKLAAVSGTKQGSPSVTKAKESSIQANTSSRSENQAARLQVKEPYTIDIEKLKAKETQRVIPVHVESPEEIYVQIADAEKIGKVNEFSALLADMQPIPYMTPRVDDSCCALFTDETWYRAKVLSVNGDICRVFFYDYGNTFETAKDRLRVMPNELKSLPGQAIRVTLCDIEPAGATWAKNAKAFLEERIVFQPCMFDVLKTENERTFGKMICEEIGEDVGKLLVDAKLAFNSCKEGAKYSNEVRKQDGKSADEVSSKEANSSSNDLGHCPSTKAYVPVFSKHNGAGTNDSEGFPSVCSKDVEKKESDFSGDVVDGKMSSSRYKNSHYHSSGLKPRSKSCSNSENEDSQKNGFANDQSGSKWNSGSNHQKFAGRGYFRGAGRGASRGASRGGSRGPGFMQNNGFPEAFPPPAFMEQMSNFFENAGNLPFDPQLLQYYSPFLFPFNPYMFSNQANNANLHGGDNRFASNGSVNGFGNLNGARGKGVCNQRGRTRGRGRDINVEFHQRESSSSSNDELEQNENGNLRGRVSRGRGGMPHGKGGMPYGRGGMPYGRGGMPYGRGGMPFGRGSHNFRGNHSAPNNNVPRGGINGFTRGSYNKRKRFPQEKTLPSLFSGVEIECKISCLEDLWHFYIMLDAGEENTNLSSVVYEDGEKLELVNEGMLCAAKNPVEDSYFRAIIESVYSDTKVLVRDADKGRTEIAEKSNLRRLIPEDFKKPFRATRCRLFNIVPLIRNKWSTEAIRYFAFKLDSGNIPVTAVVRGETSSGDILINIKDPDDPNKFIADDIVNKGFARYLRPDR